MLWPVRESKDLTKVCSPTLRNNALSSSSSNSSGQNDLGSSNLISDFEAITMTDLSGNEHKSSGDDEPEDALVASDAFSATKDYVAESDGDYEIHNPLAAFDFFGISAASKDDVDGSGDHHHSEKNEPSDSDGKECSEPRNDSEIDRIMEENNNINEGLVHTLEAAGLLNWHENWKPKEESSCDLGDDNYDNYDDVNDVDDSLSSDDASGMSSSWHSESSSDEDEVSQQSNKNKEEEEEEEEEEDMVNVFQDKSFAKNGRIAVEVPEKCYDRIHTIVDNIRKSMNEKNRKQFENLKVENMRASCKARNVKFPFSSKWLDLVAKFMLKNSRYKFVVQAWIDDNNKHLNSFFQHYAGFEDLHKNQIAKMSRVLKMLLCNIVKYDFQGLSLAREENGLKKMTFADTFEKLNECMYKERASEKVPRQLNLMCELSQITMSTNYGNNIHDMFTGIGTGIDKMVQQKHLSKRDLQELLVLTCCLNKAHRYRNLHLWVPMLNEYYNNNHVKITDGKVTSGNHFDATTYKEMLSKYSDSKDHMCLKLKKQKEETLLVKKKGGKVVISRSPVK